jgi:hypothetical protein
MTYEEFQNLLRLPEYGFDTFETTADKKYTYFSPTREGKDFMRDNNEMFNLIGVKNVKRNGHWYCRKENHISKDKLRTMNFDIETVPHPNGTEYLLSLIHI